MLDEFLNKNGNIFTVLAFFMALAGYFFNLLSTPETEIHSMLYVGIVSCIIISILISLIILKKLFQEPAGKSIFHCLAFNFENLERFVFVIPFLFIILTFIFYICNVFNIETNVLIGAIGVIISATLYLQMFKIKFFKEHHYVSPILILVVSVTIEYYILPYEKNLSFLPLNLAVSFFAGMSIFNLIFILILDAKKVIANISKIKF